MSIELKITGDNAQQFYLNAANAFMLLAQGGNAIFAAKPTNDAPQTPPPTETAGAVQEAVAEPNPPVDVKPSRTTRKKPPVTIEATAEPVAPPPPDEDPLGLNDVAKPAETETTYTLDDMRQRVKDILAMHGPKDAKDAPKEARGNDMAACVAYVRKLFAPFNVKLAADLKPPQFADFMKASQAYLDGTAEA